MSKSLAAAFAIPVLVLLGWCAMLERGIATGAVVRIEVAGYDPRDLLSGHYVRYVLSFKGNQPCQVSGNSRTECVCLAQDLGDGYHHAVWSGACEVRPNSCDVYLRGRCNYGRFSAGVEQYYIPEELSPVLQTIPERSSVVLAVQRNGAAQIKALLVEDETIEDYARRKNAP